NAAEPVQQRLRVQARLHHQQDARRRSDRQHIPDGAEVEFAVLHVAEVAGVEDLDLVDVTLAVLDLPGLLAALLEPLPVLVPERPATRVLWVVDVEDAVLTQSSSPRSDRSARPRRRAIRPGR